MKLNIDGGFGQKYKDNRKDKDAKGSFGGLGALFGKHDAAAK